MYMRVRHILLVVLLNDLKSCRKWNVSLVLLLNLLLMVLSMLLMVVFAINCAKGCLPLAYHYFELHMS